MTCRWIDIAELAERSDQWRELARSSSFPSAFADPGWVLAWWRAYGQNRQSWCLALDGADESLRGLALLTCRRVFGLRTLTFAGDTWNGVDTLLCAPDAEEELCVELAEALAERRRDWDVWRLRRLPSQSRLARLLIDGSGPLRAAAHDVRLQPFLALPRDPEEFESRFGSKQRNTQRRKWRKLLELGASPRLVDDPEEAGFAVRKLLALRRARAETQQQRYTHMNDRFERFLVDAMQAMLPAGARLWTLELGDQTLAMRLNLVQGPREHSFLLGLGEPHMSLSPGSGLERHAILHMIGEGRTELDLGPGRDAYKYRLGADDRELMRLIAPSPSARGGLLGVLPASELRLRKTALAELVRRQLGMSATQPRQASKAAAPAKPSG